MLYFAVLSHYSPEALAAVEVPEPPTFEPYLEAQVDNSLAPRPATLPTLISFKR